jgi:hypothetical protein
MRLPETDAETKAWFIAWLEDFSSHVRAVDYASAEPLFHPDILAFGTHQDVLRSLEAWVETQWDNVWPRTDDFRFMIAEVHVLVRRTKALRSLSLRGRAPASTRMEQRSIVRNARRSFFIRRMRAGSASTHIYR